MAAGIKLSPKHLWWTRNSHFRRLIESVQSRFPGDPETRTFLEGSLAVLYIDLSDFYGIRPKAWADDLCCREENVG